MTKAEFQRQTTERRFQAVYEWGFLMHRRQLDRQTLAIYMIKDYFVLVELSRDNNEVLEVNAYAPEELPFSCYQDIASEAGLLSSAAVFIERPCEMVSWPRSMAA